MREALRYLNTAREILKSAPVEDDTYLDVKDALRAARAFIEKMAY